MARGAPRTSNNVGRSLAQGAAQHAPPAKRTGDQADLGAARACAPAAVLGGAPAPSRVTALESAGPEHRAGCANSVTFPPHKDNRESPACESKARFGNACSRLHGVESVDCRLPDGVLFIFFAGAYIYGLGEFLTSQATTGWAAAIASAGAAIVALVIARNARDQNEKSGGMTASTTRHSAATTKRMPRNSAARTWPELLAHRTNRYRRKRDAVARWPASKCPCLLAGSIRRSPRSMVSSAC